MLKSPRLGPWLLLVLLVASPEFLRAQGPVPDEIGFDLPDYAQEPSYNLLTGHLYMRSTYAQSITAAKTDAASMGATLLCLDDATEEAWVQTVFGDQIYWLGLQRTPNQDPCLATFDEWYDGMPLSYTHWAPGEPNHQLCNSGPGGEHFAVMGWGGGWNDVSGLASVDSFVSIFEKRVARVSIRADCGGTGHTWLQLFPPPDFSWPAGSTKESYGWGFYPERDPFAWIPSVPGYVNPGDTDRDFDVEYTFAITLQQFNLLLSIILADQYNPPDWQVAFHNCTHWAREKLSIIGIDDLPAMTHRGIVAPRGVCDTFLAAVAGSVAPPPGSAPEIVAFFDTADRALADPAQLASDFVLAHLQTTLGQPMAGTHSLVSLALPSGPSAGILAVDWGDGTFDYAVDASLPFQHYYGQVGVYAVRLAAVDAGSVQVFDLLLDVQDAAGGLSLPVPYDPGQPASPWSNSGFAAPLDVPPAASVRQGAPGWTLRYTNYVNSTLHITPLVLGHTSNVFAHSNASNTFGLLLYAAPLAQPTYPFGPEQPLLLDLNTLGILTAFTTGPAHDTFGNSLWHSSFRVPSSAVLAGAEVAMMAITLVDLPFQKTGLDATNTLVLTVGY